MTPQVNWTKQAILAGALLALGTTAYWLEFKHRPETESKEEQNKKLFNLKDVKVDSLTLNDGTGRSFQINCSSQSAQLCKPGDNSKWELALPVKLKADDSNVNALVSALNNLAVTETVDLKDDSAEKRATLLKEYGLDAATRAQSSTRRIEVATPQGTTVLYLGLHHPIGDSLFALTENVPAGQKATGKVDDSKVYLVPTYFKSNFDHDLTYWRDKKLMTASAHEIESFDLAGPKGLTSGIRKDGQWTLKSGKGEEFPGDIENIDNLLTAATYLTAKNFVADKKDDLKAKAALQGSRSVLTLVMRPEKGQAKETPTPLTLTLFQKGTKLYATVSNLDPLYELEPTALDRLNKEFKDFRLTKLITSMERFTAKRIEIAGKALGGGAPIVLKSADSKWTMEGEKTEPNSDKIQNLLDRLSGNRILEFSSNVPAGETDGWNIKIADEKGELKRNLAFWKSGAKLYGRDLLSKRTEAFVIDPSVNEVLPKSRDHFMKKDVPPSPAPGLPGAPQPPGMEHIHGAGGGAGSPPEPGKPLIPVPQETKKK